MSYILDALVKADQQRQRQGVPGLHTIQAAALAGRAPPRRGQVALGAALLLVAALSALGWLQYRQGTRPDGVAVAPGMAVLTPALPSVPAPQSVPAMQPVAPGAAPSVSVEAPAAAPRQEHSKPDARPSRSAAAAREAKVLPAAPAAALAEAKGERKTEPTPESKTEAKPESARLYSIAELPAALQKEAQKIVIAGFSHAADANDRMAIINDKAMREGDEVAGLRIVQISGDGVVFSLKGYRFRKGGG